MSTNESLIIVLMFNSFLFSFARYVYMKENRIIYPMYALMGLLGIASHTLYLTTFASDMALWIRVFISGFAFLWMFIFIVSFANMGMLGTWPRFKRSNTPQ